MLWHALALQYGASVTLDLDDDVTHVVAAGPLTQKVKWAQRHGCHVVSPAWLQATGAPGQAISSHVCRTAALQLTTAPFRRPMPSHCMLLSLGMAQAKGKGFHYLTAWVPLIPALLMHEYVTACVLLDFSR